MNRESRDVMLCKKVDKLKLLFYYSAVTHQNELIHGVAMISGPSLRNNISALTVIPPTGDNGSDFFLFARAALCSSRDTKSHNGHLFPIFKRHTHEMSHCDKSMSEVCLL